MWIYSDWGCEVGAVGLSSPVRRCDTWDLTVIGSELLAWCCFSVSVWAARHSLLLPVIGLILLICRVYRGMFVMLWFILRSRSPDLSLNVASVFLAGSLFLQKPEGRLVPGSLGAAKEISRLSWWSRFVSQWPWILPWRPSFSCPLPLKAEPVCPSPQSETFVVSNTFSHFPIKTCSFQYLPSRCG